MKIIIVNENLEIINLLNDVLVKFSIVKDIELDIIKTTIFSDICEHNKQSNYLLNLVDAKDSVLFDKIKACNESAVVVAVGTELYEEKLNNFLYVNINDLLDEVDRNLSKILEYHIEYTKAHKRVFKLEDGSEKEFTLSDIHFIKPAYRQKYVEFFLYDTSVIVKGILKDFENLPNFEKISRNTIINKSRIQRVLPMSRTSKYVETGLKNPSLHKKCKMSVVHYENQYLK